MHSLKTKIIQNRTVFSITIMAVLLIACSIGFLFIGIRGNFSYAINRRLALVFTIYIVALAQGVSTIVFHTITNNRILTPSIIGFENLYQFIQTALVFFFGGNVLVKTEGLPKILIQSAIMVFFAFVLYRWLFISKKGNLYTMLLVGVVIGMAFSSASSFMQRYLTDSDFDILTTTTYASITNSKANYLPICFIIMGACFVYLYLIRHILDALALGEDVCVNLGINYKRQITYLLVIIAVLISLSTSLVGPLTFFGFLAATLTYELCKTHKHVFLLPFSGLFGACALMVGQFVLENIFSAEGYLTIILEFVGGLTFIIILLKRSRT